MKVKRLVLAIFVVAALLTSCDERKTLGEVPQIGFASQVDRAIVDGVDDLYEAGISLFGTVTLDGATHTLFDGDRLYYDTDLAMWDYLNPRFWTPGAVHKFYAVWPHNVTNNSFSAETAKVTVANYESTLNGTDLLYTSETRDLTATENYSPVMIKFKHACSAVQFNIINAAQTEVVDVRNVYLVGVQYKGAFSFDADGAASWQANDERVTNTSMFAGTCTLPTGGLPVNLNVKHSLYDSGALLMVPQSIYKTAVKLCLEYKMKGSNAYEKKEIELGKLGDNTPREWNPGGKYEYNLTITDNTITTEVRVIDWIEHYVDL